MWRSLPAPLSLTRICLVNMGRIRSTRPAESAVPVAQACQHPTVRNSLFPECPFCERYRSHDLFVYGLDSVPYRAAAAPVSHPSHPSANPELAVPTAHCSPPLMLMQDAADCASARVQCRLDWLATNKSVAVRMRLPYRPRKRSLRSITPEDSLRNTGCDDADDVIPAPLRSINSKRRKT